MAGADGGAAAFIGGDLGRGCTADGGDFPFEFADAGLARVGVDDADQGVVTEGE